MEDDPLNDPNSWFNTKFKQGPKLDEVDYTEVLPLMGELLAELPESPPKQLH